MEEDEKIIFQKLEEAINEIMENVNHPVHDKRHPLHAESLIAFNKLLEVRENMVMTEKD